MEGLKTSVNMVRKIDNYDILQRTKDGYFDANTLLIQWNKVNKRKRLDEFLNYKKTIEFIESIKQEESHWRENANADNQVVIIKKGRVLKTGRSKDEVWMHPYLFIDFAMWLNPKFKYHVIKFVHDQLISVRVDAGGGYKKLSGSGKKLKGYNYKKVAEAMNYIVFNSPLSGQRQVANEIELKEINDIQDKLSYLIEMDFITSFCQLMDTMRKMYKNKYSIKF